MGATFWVSTWNALILQLCCVFTEPTAGVWRQIALGWVLRRGPATVTGMFRTIGQLADRHWTVYHKFFYRARWSLDALSAALLRRVILPMILESGGTDSASGKPVADLAIDDTTVGRYGKHVAHAGWFHDASATGPATKGTVIHWAHNWLVGAVTLRLPKWPLVRWVLPCVFALYRKRDDCNRSHPFATRQALAARMVREVAAALPGVLLRVSTDGAYAGRILIRALPEGVSLVSRLRCDAALNALPPTRRRRGKLGRRPLKGRRLPTPKEMAARRKRGWVTITVQRQGQEVERKVLGMTCLWYHVCRTAPIRLVMVRDPRGIEEDDFFFSTDARVSDAEIVQRYYDRWGVEESILESKQQMGFESTRGWCSKTVHRQAPLAMVLVTLVKAWYARVAADEPSLRPEGTPWQSSKTRPSFLDMLSALRRVLWRHRISPKSRFTVQVRQILETVSYALCAAA
jgi:DDE superfamily endonuclease